MITDTKTIFEHWTDEELQSRMDNAEHADPGMLEGVRAEAFILDALAMAARGQRAAELVELFRDSEWSERWSMTHPTEPRVIVYFNEAFPAKVKKVRGTGIPA